MRISMDIFITVSEAAALHKLNPSTVRRAILRNDLPAIKMGKTWLIKPADFETWISNPAMHKTGKKI